MGLKVSRLKKKELFIACCMILLLFFNAIPEEITAIKYFDEFLGIIMLFALANNLKKWMPNKDVKIILFSLIGIVVFGILFNMISGIISYPMPILVDAFGVIKNHIIFIAIVFAIGHVDYTRIINFIIPIVKMLILVVFIFGVINVFMDVGMSTSYRYGLKSYQFIFTNPAMVGIIMIICVGFLDFVHYKGILKYLAFISMSLTLRATVFVVIAIYFIVSIVLRFNNRIRWYHITLLALVGVSVAWWMVGEYYILDKQSNRFLLLYYGFVVFKRYFPLGAGFATYGSQMAYTYYSPFYREFGFLNHWGLNDIYGGTVNDNFWPMVMAQFGVVGILCFVVILWREFRIINKVTDDKLQKIGILAIYFSLVCSTLGSADLTGIAGTVRYFALGIMVGALINKKNRVLNIQKDK